MTKLLKLIMLFALLPLVTAWGQEPEDTVGTVVFVDSVPQGTAYVSSYDRTLTGESAKRLTPSMTTPHSLQHPARLTAEVNGTPKESPLEIRDGDSVSLAVTSDFEISEVEWLLKMKGIDGDCWEKALSGNAEGCRFIMQYSLFTLWNSVNIETMFPCTTDPATMLSLIHI